MSDNYREVDVPDRPGWTRIVEGSNRRYRSPDGITVSNAAWAKLASAYPAPRAIPEHAVIAAANIKSAGDAFAASRAASQPRPFMQAKSAPGVVAAPVSPLEQQLQQQQVRTSAQAGVDIGVQAPPSQRPPVHPQPAMPADEVVQLSMPDPRVDAARGRPSAKSNRATPRELSDGLYITLSIVTAIVALLLSEPTLAMTDLEAKNISIPAANLLAKSQLNERFGRLIAESGDWQLLGYALWLYSSRAWDIVQVKAANRHPRPQQPYQAGYQPQPQQPSPNGHNMMPNINMPRPPPGVNYGLQ